MVTARGALWKAEFDQQGILTSPTGCDRTLTANTLCLSNVVVAYPILEGGDGIILDRTAPCFAPPIGTLIAETTRRQQQVKSMVQQS